MQALGKRIWKASLTGKWTCFLRWYRSGVRSSAIPQSPTIPEEAEVSAAAFPVLLGAHSLLVAGNLHASGPLTGAVSGPLGREVGAGPYVCPHLAGPLGSPHSGGGGAWAGQAQHPSLTAGPMR